MAASMCIATFPCVEIGFAGWRCSFPGLLQWFQRVCRNSRDFCRCFA